MVPDAEVDLRQFALGRGAEILLVRPSLGLAVLGLWLALAAPAAAQTVRAEDYDAYWVWAGVAPQPLLAGAKTLYVLQGQVEPIRGDPSAVRLVAQGGAITPVRQGQVWLAYRAHTLRWTPDIYAKIRARVARWRAAGVPVAGVQIDFDARTRHLDEYAAFLRDARGRLGPGERLSITGLLDWGAGRDPAALNALGGVVDEVVIQTYQGRRTIPGYGAYLGQFERLRFPFKVGVVQGGEWRAPAGLADNPWFRGYVVFLKNPAPRPPPVARPASTAAMPVP
jgi:hypothetical protein